MESRGVPVSEDRDKEAAAGRSGWFARLFRGARARRSELDRTPIPVARFQNVCLTREAGAGGSSLARNVGRRLDWRVYDHELLEAIARRMEVPIDDVRKLDELSPSVIQDWILPLREEYYAPLEAYLDHLAKLVIAIGLQGESIIVGRGAGFMLPRESTLNVLIVAPLKSRAKRLAEREGLSPRTARRVAIERDRRAKRFIRSMYHVDPSDPHNYDLVIDTDSVGLPIAAEILIRAIESGRPGALKKLEKGGDFDRPIAADEPLVTPPPI